VDVVFIGSHDELSVSDESLAELQYRRTIAVMAMAERLSSEPQNSSNQLDTRSSLVLQQNELAALGQPLPAMQGTSISSSFCAHFRMTPLHALLPALSSARLRGDD